MNISSLLDEAVKHSDFVRRAEPTYVVGDLVEEDDWMREAIRQFQHVAPAHAAYLKKETGRGWKLFKNFLTENGRLIFRFDLARRQDITQDPMIVLRMAYSRSADLYNLQVEVWKSVGEQIAAHEIDDVDVEMLQDPERVYYRVEKALAQLKQVREGLRESMPTGLPMTRKDFIPWDSGIRHRDTGKVMVPSATELANTLAYELGAIRWTKDFRTKAAHGAVAIYEKDPSDVVALVGLVNGKVGFESHPQEPDEKVNEAVRKALDSAMRRFRPWDPSAKGESMSFLSSDLTEALSEGSDKKSWRPEMEAALSKLAQDNYWAKSADIAAALRAAGVPDGVIRDELRHQLVWPEVQTKVWKGKKTPPPPTSRKTESVGGWDSLEEARLNLGAEGGSFGSERTNPTKSGPAAERANTLKSARAGIERMIQAIETVRGWVKAMNLGDKDKTGAAAAALKIAATEIAKVEDVQGILGSMFELPALSEDAATALDEAILFVEKRAEMTPDAARAKEGLARMVDGLRQLLGMLRQAKITGRILDQVEAAIGGLKATRDAIDALFEGIVPSVATNVSYDKGARDKLYPPSGMYDKFSRMKAGEVRKGFWVRGGTLGDPIYREVLKVGRSDDDMAYVVFTFGAPYLGADGIERDTARFHKDAVVTAAKG